MNAQRTKASSTRIANAWLEKIPGGLASGRDLDNFDLEQLIKGLDVEMEHTDDPMVALEIAMDHLTEDEKYYDKLEKIEKHASISRVANLYLRARYGIDVQQKQGPTT